MLLLFVSLNAVMAQQANKKTQERKFRIHLVTEDNGKTNVIDKEFGSKEEMDAYLKEQGQDLPPAPDLPELPTLPEPPTPPTAPNLPEKSAKVKVNCSDSSRIEKIITINKEGIDDEGEVVEVTVSNEGDGEVEKTITKTVDTTGKVRTEITVIKRTVIIKDEGNAKALVAEQQIVSDSVNTNISALNFYPNPNNGRFYVSFKVDKAADVTLRITDINGREVYSDTKTNFSGLYEKNFYEGHWEAGIYLMQVTAGQEKQALKITVQE